MHNSKHLSTGTISLAPKKDHVRKVFFWIGIYVVTALALETLTVFGTPQANIFNMSDWSIKRVAVFFLIVVIASAWIRYLDSHGAFDNFKQYWSLETGHYKKLIFVFFCSAAIFSVAYLIFIWILDISDFRITLTGAIVCVDIFLFLLFHKTIATAFEWGYLILALSLGSLFCLYVPPTTFYSYDDQIHYDNSLALSYVLYPKYTKADFLLIQVGDLWDLDGGIYYPDHAPQMDLSTWKGLANEINKLKNEVIYTPPSATGTSSGNSYISVSFVGHIPNAIGLWIGRLLHISEAATIILGRLSSVVFFVLVIFLSMRRLKSGKLIVAAFGLIPSTLFLAANYSYDPWLISLITYSISSYVGELQQPDKKIENYNIFRMLLPFLLGTLVKAVYFPLAFIFCFMKKTKFVSTKQQKRYLLLICLTCLALVVSIFIPLMFLSSSTLTDVRGESGVNGAEQIVYVLQNPLDFIHTFLSFSKGFLSLDNSIVGVLSNFAYITAKGPISSLEIGIEESVFLIILCLIDRAPIDKNIAASKVAIPSLISIFISYVLCAAALYVSFTPVANTTINGMQHRYLIPLLMPLLLVSCYCHIYNTIPKSRIAKFFVIVETVLSCQVLFTMFISAF